MELKLPEYLGKQLQVFIDTWNARAEAANEAYGLGEIKLLEEQTALYIAITRAINTEKATLEKLEAYLRERDESS